MSADFGTYRAIVVNTNDPLSEERVTLNIPQVLGDAESNWAVPNAPTNQHPEPGDVVWVTFDGGDINAPVYAAVGLKKLDADVQNIIDGNTTVGTDSTIPKPPTNLTGTSSISHTTEGVGFADLTVSWTAPTENVDATSLTDLQGYVTAWSYDGTNWAGGAYDTDVTWTFHNLLPATDVHVRVLAFDKSGNYSDYATAVITTATNDGPPAGSTLAQQSSAITTAQSTADSAKSAASTAQTTADGKNTVTYSTSAPGTAANKAGDVWFVRDATSGNITGQWEGQGGTTWVQRQLSHETIASIDAATITVGKLSASQIDATNLVVSGSNVNGSVSSATTAGSATSASSATTVTGSIGAGVTVPAGQLSNGTIPTTTTINGGSITTGTIDASKATITNLNASNITAGTLSTDKLSVGVQSSVVQKMYDVGNSAQPWTIRASSSGATVTSVQDTASQTGGYLLRIQKYVQMTRDAPGHPMIPFDPGVLYRVTVRVRQKTNPSVSGTNLFYAGVAGYAADGVTPVNATGSASYGSQFYVATLGTGLAAADGWHTFTGYIKGWVAAGTNASSSPRNDPRTPAALYSTVRYITPIIYANYNGGDGTVDIDLFTIEVVESGAATGVNIADGAIDGKTIIGATLETAASGKRWVINSSPSNSLTSYSGVSGETAGFLTVDYDTTNGCGYMQMQPPMANSTYPVPTFSLYGAGSKAANPETNVTLNADSGTIGPFYWDSANAAGMPSVTDSRGLSAKSMLVASGSGYATPPTNGLYVQGASTLNGVVTSNGIYNNTGTFTANVGIASSPQGNLYRITSSQRYKVEIQPEDVSDAAVMALVPKTYVDKGQYEEAVAAGLPTEGLPRYLGLIAEDVAQIPELNEILVPKNDDGLPESVAYDRISVALIPMLQRLANRVAVLESEVAALKAA